MSKLTDMTTDELNERWGQITWRWQELVKQVRQMEKDKKEVERELDRRGGEG